MNKKVTRFENYTINEFGEVFSEKGERVSEKNELCGPSVKLFKNNRAHKVKVKKIVYCSFVDPFAWDNKFYYIDKNPKNNHWKNISFFGSSTKRFSKKDLENIFNLYKEGKKIREISRIFRTKDETISKILKENNFHVFRRNEYRLDYSLNGNYFKKIDSRDKSYLLGLMYADGCVSELCNTITLTSKDDCLLNFFAEQIELKKDIYRSPKNKSVGKMRFSSHKMKKDLVDLGCVPRKSLILQFPSKLQVPDNLMPDFIRGYFDGDGSVYLNNKNADLAVQIISSTAFATSCKLYLESIGINCGKIARGKKHKKETGFFRITGRQNIDKFSKFIYYGNPFCLKRKKEIFKKNKI